MGKNINLPRFPEKNGPELSCGRNLPFGKVNADAGSVEKRGIELNNESGDLRRCKNRPPPMKTRRYHASQHHPTLTSISNSCMVCCRLPTHHQLKIPTNSPVGIFLPAGACSRGLAWVPADFAEDPGGGIRPRFLSPLAGSLRSGAL